VYRRHTNFAIESIEQTFNGTVDFGRKVSCTVSRNGDLINKAYLQLNLPALGMNSGTCNWTRNVGHSLIDYVNIEIGGQEIDRHYGDWLNIWNELTQTAEKEDGYMVMIGNTTTLTTPALTIPATTLYIPLQFWFCRNPGLALPLIALQYHEVKFNISFTPASQNYITSTGSPPSATGVPQIGYCSLYIDYIYLDTDERRQFAQVQHEYLIEQLQFTGAESYNNSAIKSKLALNHPCKFLAWVFQLDNNVAANINRWSDYTASGISGGGNPYTGNDTLSTAKLQLNGQDRFSVRQATYFNVVQPYQSFTRCPATGIYVYSFALNPLDHQPSGSVNMSRIDNATLLLDLTTGTNSGQLRVYAVNYNVLRIMSGMGGLAFSSGRNGLILIHLLLLAHKSKFLKEFASEQIVRDTFKLTGNSLESKLPLTFRNIYEDHG
jgi:hypothetical protein